MNKNQGIAFRLRQLYCTGLGLGMIKKAPGTWGSIPGIFLGMYLLQYPGWLAYLACACLFFISIPIINQYEKDVSKKDAQEIVIDEILGQTVTILGLRYFVLKTGDMPSYWYFLIAFIVFRILDITKPFPAKTLEKQNGGLGVLADDVVSGLYGALCLYLLLKVYKGI